MNFFVIVPTVYACMHAYIFWRLRSAFGPGIWQLWTLLLFSAMVAAFFLRRMALNSPFLTILHWVAMLWMGLILITVTWVFFLDCARILAWLTYRLTGLFGTGTSLSQTLRLSRSLPWVLGLCLVLSVYAFYEAVAVRPVRLTIPTAKLPPGVSRLRLAVMSDIHLSSVVGPWRLKRMTAIVNEEKPDILLMLGDLVDTDMSRRDEDAALLRAVIPPDGGYAVLGNHEAYSGLANSLRFTEKAGFRVLRGESVRVRGITIAGVDDPMFISGRHTGDPDLPDRTDMELMLGLEQDRAEKRFILFLRHRPGRPQHIAGLFDLQLSGHTHGGQIWPARVITRMVHKFAQGMTLIEGGRRKSLLYLSNGTGVWGPPMRLFTPPEVTIIDLVAQE